MRRALFALCFLVLASCVAVEAPPAPGPWVPAPPPAPAPPPPPPPIPEPPPQPPPPATVEALLARITVGATLTEAIASVGVHPAVEVPESPGAPGTLRWFVIEGEARFMVFAAMRGGRVVDKGSSRVEVVR